MVGENTSLVYVRLHLEKSDEPIFDWVDANEIKPQTFSFAVTFPFWVVFLKNVPIL